jgi:hypothetical protein
MSPQLLERIRDHAAALDDAAPPIRVDELRRPVGPPKRRAGRLPLTAAAGVVAVVGGLVAINNSRDIDDTVASTLPATVEEAAPATADAEPRLELAGAEPIGDVQFTVASAEGAIWKDAETETYLSLTVRSGLAEGQPTPTGIGPMRELGDFPTDLGRAWVTDLDDSELTTPLTLRMWWTRHDGHVWLLTSYLYEPATTGVDAANAVSALTGWLTHIVTPDDPAAAYELDDDAVTDSSMELVFSQRAGEFPSRLRTWDIDGQEIMLETTEGVAASGLQNLLDVGPPTVTTIAGRPGWLAQADDGTVHAGWATDSTERWNRVIIPAGLGPRSTEIIDSIVETAPSSVEPQRTLPAPADVALEDIGGLLIGDATSDQSYQHGTLARVDPEAAEGPQAVVVRDRDGNIADRTAVVIYETGAPPAEPTFRTNPRTDVITFVDDREEGRIVVRGIGLSEDDITAIADSTTIVDGQPVVTNTPELANFEITAADSLRPRRTHESRYGCDALGEQAALGALCYAGLTTGPGFQAALYGADFRPGPDVNGHLTVVSTVGGGNGTLAWEPTPGLIAYVGYSGSSLGEEQIEAMARLAARATISPPEAWQATQPQVVTQNNGW